MRAALASARDRWNRLGSLVPAVAVALVVLALTAASTVVTDARAAEQARADLDARGQSIAAAFERTMASHASTTQALAAWAQASTPIDHADFLEVSTRLLAVQPGIRALELAPNGVITHVHPLVGNEAAVGLDLNVHPTGQLALAALRAGEPIVVEGPIDLAQGGRAAIIRSAIELPGPTPTSPREFWGVSINVIDLDALMAQSGLNDADVKWGLYAGEGAVATTTLVAGRALLGQEPSVHRISVPGGSWELALVPLGGWPTGAPSRNLVVVSGLLLALSLAILTFVLRRQPARLRNEVAQATAEVQRSHQRTRAVMNAAADAILAIDRHGDVIDWNPAALRLLRTGDGIRGRQVRGFVDIARLEAEEQDDGTHVGRGSLEVHRADGSSFPAEVSVAWSSTSPVRTVVIRDVTEQQRQNEDLRRHVLELERLNSEQMAIDVLKRDFMQMASHEVRTPITAIRGFALTLNKHWDQLADEDRRRSLDVIHRQATRLWHLLNNILLTSQLEGGSVEQRVDVIDVATIIQSSLTESQVPMNDVHVECPEHMTASVDGDHLQRVLVALVTNADKYGGAPIRVVAKVDGSDLVIRVTDNGPGVPFSFRSRLFEPFSQASTGVRREAIGTGLGLAVARGLARANGGDVWHEDHPGSGATFALRFPRTARRAAPVDRVIPADRVQSSPRARLASIEADAADAAAEAAASGDKLTA